MTAIKNDLLLASGNGTSSLMIGSTTTKLIDTLSKDSGVQSNNGDVDSDSDGAMTTTSSTTTTSSSMLMANNTTTHASSSLTGGGGGCGISNGMNGSHMLMHLPSISQILDTLSSDAHPVPLAPN